MAQFQSTLSEYRAQFTNDKTYTLIVRLRQNVIKTGVRRLSLSYSRISLRDICVKLHLDSEEDAEYIVGKAIRDGVIEGKVVHEKGWVECGGVKSGYGPEVADVFGRRIGYCLELHNESVKVSIDHQFKGAAARRLYELDSSGEFGVYFSIENQSYPPSCYCCFGGCPWRDEVSAHTCSFIQAMRYPLNAHRKELAAAEGAREREKELAKEIQDGGDLGDDDGLGDSF